MNNTKSNNTAFLVIGIILSLFGVFAIIVSIGLGFYFLINFHQNLVNRLLGCSGSILGIGVVFLILGIMMIPRKKNRCTMMIVSVVTIVSILLYGTVFFIGLLVFYNDSSIVSSASPTKILQLTNTAKPSNTLFLRKQAAF
jgi:ABC-type transport system involved in multi-copper enzyme maturation permease subunit